jgi:hypothetical protein
MECSDATEQQNADVCFVSDQETLRDHPPY